VLFEITYKSGKIRVIINPNKSVNWQRFSTHPYATQDQMSHRHFTFRSPQHFLYFCQIFIWGETVNEIEFQGRYEITTLVNLCIVDEE
jgi:hypothetical protein